MSVRKWLISTSIKGGAISTQRKTTYSSSSTHTNTLQLQSLFIWMGIYIRLFLPAPVRHPTQHAGCDVRETRVHPRSARTNGPLLFLNEPHNNPPRKLWPIYSLISNCEECVCGERLGFLCGDIARPPSSLSCRLMLDSVVSQYACCSSVCCCDFLVGLACCALPFECRVSSIRSL